MKKLIGILLLGLLIGSSLVYAEDTVRFEKNGVVYMTTCYSDAELKLIAELKKEQAIIRSQEVDDELWRQHEINCLEVLYKIAEEERRANEAYLEAIIAEGTQQPDININAEGGDSLSYSSASTNSYGNSGNGGGQGTSVNNTLINVSDNTNNVTSKNTNKQ